MYDGNIGFKSKWGVGSTFGYKIAIENSEILQTLKQSGSSKVELVEQTER